MSAQRWEWDARSRRGLLGIGRGALVMEVMVLALAIPAYCTAERGHVSAAAVAYLVGVLVLLLVAAGTLTRRSGRAVATLAQPAAVVGGVFTWPMYVVGVVFVGIWAYYLRLWLPPDTRPARP